MGGMERTKRFAWVVFAILILSAIFVFGDSNTVDSQDSHGKVENNLPNSMKLVWSEEFNDDKNIAKFWTFEIGNGQKKGNPGWGNGELEYYTDKNWYISDGMLVIEARKENIKDQYGTYNYTSTRMITQGKVSIKYGRIEARAKLPVGKGLWPAIWLLGEDINKVGWPSCGEIDIMEYLGHDTKTVYGTVHGPGYSGAKGISKPYRILDESQKDFSQTFYTFALEWDENEIRWYVNDVNYHKVSKETIENRYMAKWVFDKPFFLILNVAVGGYWPGYPDQTTKFPQAMYIDYVRIYSK